MRRVNYLLFLFILFACIYPQNKSNLKKVIEFPNQFSITNFLPTNISISPTGIYFLDGSSRQIAFLSNSGDVFFAGGYGIDYDALIDPIEILSSKLLVWIVDRTENKLIEFDHKLNYLRSIEFDRIYPEFGGIDNWGNILLQSSQEQIILKSSSPIKNFDEFIDLSRLNDINSCISDVHIANDGTVGILSNCNNSVHLFNRLGKLENKYYLEKTEGSFLIKRKDEWFVISSEGQINSIRYNEKVKLPIEQNILDVAQMEGKLYLLFYNKIWIVDVSME